MKKTLVKKMIEEAIAMTRLIISSLDMVADSVNNIIKILLIYLKYNIH